MRYNMIFPLGKRKNSFIQNAARRRKVQDMKIIVCGCGKIGSTILASLVREGHDVVALDNSQEVITEITNVYDVIGVVGNGADYETLEEAGVDKTDLFISVTPSDERNMLACFLARKMGAKHTIARIRNPEYNDNSLGFMRQQLELSMSINPELLAAEELYNILKLPSAVKVEKFSRRAFEMIEVRLKPDSPLDGMKLIDLRAKYKAKFLICAVQREDEVFIPDGNFVLKSGDRVGITASPAEAQKLFRELGLFERQARSVMILGGSRTAYYLAKMLTNAGSDVRIIERDRALCEELCDLLPKAVIVNGDGAHQELLMEEGLSSVDAFAALTGMDEENILISIFAASRNVPKVISKVNRDELESMAERLGLDTIVSPRRIISDVLVQYARALQNSLGSHIETLYNLMDDQAEALEFRVGADFRGIGIPLKDLQIKRGILIAGIVHNRVPLIPAGADVISAGDMVIVISKKDASGHSLGDLSDILR